MEERRHLLLAGTMGFCNGVRRALQLVEQELVRGNVPLYVLHEIVHNNFVVENLRARGVVFVEDPAEVPDGACLILSAHGTAPQVRIAAEKRLRVIDAACPLVQKVQKAAMTAEKAGERIILLGHADHPEVIGILGHCSPGAIELISRPEDCARLLPDDGRPVRLLTQTTMNVDEVAGIRKLLVEKFPDVRDGAQVCYATGERQSAVRNLAKEVEYMLILGSSHSSNAVRLLETAQKENIPGKLIDLPEKIDPRDLAGIRKLGLSAGASVPDDLISRTVEYLAALGFSTAAD